MLARMSSIELTGWWALFEIKEEEDAAAAQRQRDLDESGDGIVHEYGRDPEADDDDDEGEQDDDAGPE